MRVLKFYWNKNQNIRSVWNWVFDSNNTDVHFTLAIVAFFFSSLVNFHTLKHLPALIWRVHNKRKKKTFNSIVESVIVSVSVSFFIRWNSFTLCFFWCFIRSNTDASFFERFWHDFERIQLFIFCICNTMIFCFNFLLYKINEHNNWRSNRMT